MVTRSDDLATAADLMATGEVHQLPVMEGGRLLGFVTRADVVRLIQTTGELHSIGAIEPNIDPNRQRGTREPNGRHPVRIVHSTHGHR